MAETKCHVALHLPVRISSLILCSTALLCVGAGASTPMARSFRFAVSASPFYSGYSFDDCHPLFGGLNGTSCSGGLADSLLVARSFNRHLAPKLPPLIDPSGVEPTGSHADLVEVMPLLFFAVQNVEYTDYINSHLNNATAECEVFKTLSVAALIPSDEVLNAGEQLTKCDDSLVLEAFNFSVIKGGDFSRVVSSVSLPGGLLLVRTAVMHLLGPDALAQIALDRIDGEVEAGRQPLSLLVVVDYRNVTHFAEFVSAFRALGGVHGPLLHAVVAVMTASEGGIDQPVLIDGVWFFVSDAANPRRRRVLNFDLTVPLTDAASLLGTTLRSASSRNWASAEERLGDRQWNMTAEIIDEWRMSMDSAFVPVARTMTDIICDDAWYNGTCSVADCIPGQLIAEALAFGPPPSTDTLQRGDDIIASSTVASAIQSTIAVENRTEVGISMLVEYNQILWPRGFLRGSAFKLIIPVSTCRGHLRGLTILRLIRASLSNPGQYFFQYSGLRFSYLPVNDSLGRTEPVIVEAKVRDVETGAFNPIQRTHLYSVAMSNNVQLMDPYSPIMNNPLSGEAVPCFVFNERNMRGLVGDFAARRSPLNPSLQRVTTALTDADLPEAPLAPAGLLSSETPELCAQRNALGTTNRAGVIYDPELLSCAPCPDHLVANAAADMCVAPPTPPPPPPPVDMTPVLVGAAVVVLVFLAASAAAAHILLGRWRRRHCPVDDKKPFTVAYVSTLNEGALRERHPVGVDKALRLIERTVAREAAAAGCVVAKRLDAHHMIVAKDPARALVCLSAILRKLDAANWACELQDVADTDRRERICLQRKRGPRPTSGAPPRRSPAVEHLTASGTASSSSTWPTASSDSDPTAPAVAAGLWHGQGVIEHDESVVEAFGFRYAGAVAQCAAAAAMAAGPWEVALAVTARKAAEDELWAAAGNRPDNLCDEDRLAEFDCECLYLDNVLLSDAGASDATSTPGTPSSDEPFCARLAPPQLGLAIFMPVKSEGGLSLPTGTPGQAAKFEKIVFAGLRAAHYRRRILRTGTHDIEAYDSSSERRHRGRARAADAVGGNALAAALSAASGSLAAQWVGVICVYVPALRTTLPGVSLASTGIRALLDPAEVAARRVTADDILSAAAGAAVFSRMVAALDGYLYFAVNAPQVTTAQVPVRAAQDAVKIASAVTSATGARASAGVAMGVSLVGSAVATLGEREGALKSRLPPVAVLGTVADRARALAGLAAAQTAVRWEKGAETADCLNNSARNPGQSAVSLLAASSATESAPRSPGLGASVNVAAPSTDGVGPYEPAVVVAGNFAAELSGFELEVVDVIAWPEEVTCVLPVPRMNKATGEMSAGDFSRRVALAVRVVRGVSEVANMGDDGDEEWLYQAAVVGKSVFSASNAAVAALVCPLGVATDFVSGVAPVALDGRLASLKWHLSHLADLLAKETSPGSGAPTLAAQQQALIRFAARRFFNSCFPTPPVP